MFRRKYASGIRGAGSLRVQSGFTLVEVLVVGVIMVILAAVTIPIYTGFVNKQKQEVVNSLAQTAGVSANAFTRRNGRAPVSAAEMNFFLPDPDRFGLTFTATTLTVTDRDSDPAIVATVTFN